MSVQVETLDKLERRITLTLPTATISSEVESRLKRLSRTVKADGFRPGKVPVSHLKKIYGKAVIAETIDAVIRELNGKIVSERGLKLATEPKVTIPNEEKEVEKLIGGQADLAYTLAVEILPKIDLADFQNIALERLIAEVTDDQVSEALEKIAEQNRPFAAKGEGAQAEKGDRTVIDFSGRIDGKPFEGGSGGDVGVNIGSGTFLPGFEDQLIGIKTGEKRLVKITFPANYASDALAGKDRARVPAPHGDHHVGGPYGLGGEHLGCLGGDVDADFAHRRDHGRVDCVGRGGTG